MSLQNTFQYKQCVVYLDSCKMECMIYRPDLHNVQTKRKKLKKQLMATTELSINVKTKNIFKYDYLSSFLTCPKNE